MSGVGIGYTIDDTQARALFERMETFNRAAMFEEVGGALHALTMDRFLTSTAPDGTPWKPSLRALMEGGMTLVDRTHLRDSYTWQVFLGAEGLEFGSDMIYAAIHQKGGRAGRNHAVELDARPALPDDDNWPAEYAETIGDIMDAHVSRLIEP